MADVLFHQSVVEPVMGVLRAEGELRVGLLG